MEAIIIQMLSVYKYLFVLNTIKLDFVNNIAEFLRQTKGK